MVIIDWKIIYCINISFVNIMYCHIRVNIVCMTMIMIIVVVVIIQKLD